MPRDKGCCARGRQGGVRICERAAEAVHVVPFSNLYDKGALAQLRSSLPCSLPIFHPSPFYPQQWLPTPLRRTTSHLPVLLDTLLALDSSLPLHRRSRRSPRLALRLLRMAPRSPWVRPASSRSTRLRYAFSCRHKRSLEPILILTFLHNRS